jgi:hypothetical protein
MTSVLPTLFIIFVFLVLPVAGICCNTRHNANMTVDHSYLRSGSVPGSTITHI